MLYLEIKDGDRSIARIALPSEKDEVFMAGLKIIIEQPNIRAAFDRTSNSIVAAQKLGHKPTDIPYHGWIILMKEVLRYACVQYPCAKLAVINEVATIKKEEMEQFSRDADEFLEEEDMDMTIEEEEEIRYREALETVERCRCGAYYMKPNQTLGIRADCCCGA